MIIIRDAIKIQRHLSFYPQIVLTENMYFSLLHRQLSRYTIYTNMDFALLHKGVHHHRESWTNSREEVDVQYFHHHRRSSFYNALLLYTLLLCFCKRQHVLVYMLSRVSSCAQVILCSYIYISDSISAIQNIVKEFTTK